MICRLPFSSFSSFSPIKMFSVEQLLEVPLWEAPWLFLCVPESMQMRVTAQNSNDASRFGLYCELSFLVMRHEPRDGEAAVCSPCLVCVITCGPRIQWTTEPWGGRTKGLRAYGEHQSFKGC